MLLLWCYVACVTLPKLHNNIQSITSVVGAGPRSALCEVSFLFKWRGFSPFGSFQLLYNWFLFYITADVRSLIKLTVRKLSPSSSLYQPRHFKTEQISKPPHIGMMLKPLNLSVNWSNNKSSTKSLQIFMTSKEVIIKGSSNWPQAPRSTQSSTPNRSVEGLTNQSEGGLWSKEP